MLTKYCEICGRVRLSWVTVGNLRLNSDVISGIHAWAGLICDYSIVEMYSIIHTLLFIGG